MSPFFEGFLHGSKKWRLASGRPCEPSGWLASGPKVVSERRVWAARCLLKLLRSISMQQSCLDADIARLDPCRARLWKKRRRRGGITAYSRSCCSEAAMQLAHSYRRPGFVAGAAASSCEPKDAPLLLVEAASQESAET